jgi:hypothetical protein
MSVSLMQLWMPILLGGVFCWFASAIIHMVIKYHNHDYKKLSNEEEVGDAMRNGSPAPGLYHMPHCTDMKEMEDEAVQAKFIQGPIAMISVFENGLPKMGKLLIQQFLFFIFAGVFIAYVATLALAPGADYMAVFRIVMTVGFLAFGYGCIPYSIWYGHPWANCLRYFLDAVIYAAVFAGTFAWLWPAA